MSQNIKFAIISPEHAVVVVLFPGIGRETMLRGKHISQTQFKDETGAFDVQAESPLNIDDVVSFLANTGNFSIESILVLANSGVNTNPVKQFFVQQITLEGLSEMKELTAKISTGKDESGRYFDKYDFSEPVVLTPLTVLKASISPTEKVEIVLVEAEEKVIEIDKESLEEVLDDKPEEQIL